jgi:hypothetical protein
MMTTIVKRLVYGVALTSALAANAQDSSMTTRGRQGYTEKTNQTIIWSIGVEPSVPIGKFSDYTGFGIGASLQGEYKPGNRVGITLNFGDIDYFGKTVNGVKYDNFNYLPLMGGAKLYLANNFYIHGQAGPGFGTNGLGTSFWYGGGIGVNFIPALDAELRYTGWKQNEVNTTGSGGGDNGGYGGGGNNGGYGGGGYGGHYSTIGLRVAYNF